MQFGMLLIKMADVFNLSDETKILGIRVDRMRMGEVVEKLERVINAKKKALVVTPNPEMVLLAQEDKEFLKVLNDADVAIPDGVGLLAAAKFLQLLKLNIKYQIVNIQSKYENQKR